MFNRQRCTLTSMALTAFLLCFVPFQNSMAAMPFLDDFEDGNINGWTVVAIEDVPGNAEISNTVAYESVYSMKMWDQAYPEKTVVQRDDFNAATGIYQSYFYVTGSYSDAYMYIQVQDLTNYYKIHFRPYGGDYPAAVVDKFVNGERTILSEVPPNFNMNQWFKATVYRYANGDIMVYVNDELLISVNDVTFQDPGGFCVGSWITAYADDVTYSYIKKVPSISTIGVYILALLLIAASLFVYYRRVEA
ncbi:MAG: hypothetical protein AB1746_13515 [Candidatus Zixiibacteriota bacterium]